jgi:hypothetical protein
MVLDFFTDPRTDTWVAIDVTRNIGHSIKQLHTYILQLLLLLRKCEYNQSLEIKMKGLLNPPYCVTYLDSPQFYLVSKSFLLQMVSLYANPLDMSILESTIGVTRKISEFTAIDIDENQKLFRDLQDKHFHFFIVTGLYCLLKAHLDSFINS